MINMAETIKPKSDQLNADDLISGSLTITISKMTIGQSAEQPVSVGYVGDNGKPWKPCKGMRRVLVKAWGADGSVYAGRSLTLYRDEKVTFGAQAVGGIRISHMSHITEPFTMALTTSKASRKPFTVKPLVMKVGISENRLDELKIAGEDAAEQGNDALKAWWLRLTAEERTTLGSEFIESMKAIAEAVIAIPAEEPTLGEKAMSMYDMIISGQQVPEDDVNMLIAQLIAAGDTVSVDMINGALRGE